MLYKYNNLGVVSALHKGSAKHPIMMNLLCCFWFFIAHYDIDLTCKHIAGSQNNTADNLSRCNMHFFFTESISFTEAIIPSTVTSSNTRGIRARLDILKLQRAVLSYYQQGLADSTHHSYNAAIKINNSFCQAISHTPTPTTEYTLLFFTAYLGQRKLAYSAIKVYLSAVRSLHVAAGMHQTFSSQLTPRVQQVVRSICKVQAQEKLTQLCLPVTIDIMLKIKAILSRDPHKYHNIMM